MNIDVGEMPLDIFGDYISDCLGMEYDWIYFFPVFNGFAPFSPWELEGHAIGIGLEYNMEDRDMLMDIYGHFRRESGVHVDYNGAGIDWNMAFGCGNMTDVPYGCGHDNY